MKKKTSSFAKKIAKISLGLAACAAVTVTAYAAVTFDAETGEGFVGKGDVQTALGWNNNFLQANASSVAFQYSSVTAVEIVWNCYNENNGHTQERTRTVTTTSQGVLSHVERVRNQITGYGLDGYLPGQAPTVVISTEGPPLNSCPNANSSFVLGSTTEGDPQQLSSGLQVSGDSGATWNDLE